MRLSAQNRLYVIPWLTDVTSSLFTFTVTRHLAEQGNDAMQLGIAGACGSLGYVISAAVFGHLSDRVGSRRLIGTGSLLLAAVFASALFGMELPRLYYLVTASGLVLGLIYPPLIALLATVQSGSAGSGKEDARAATRPLIRFCLSWNFGLICGQLTAGTLFAVDPRLSLVVGLAGAMGVFFVLLSTRGMAVASSADNAPPPREPEAGEVTDLHPSLRLFFAAAGWASNVVVASAMALVNYHFPQLATQLGISAPVHGGMLATLRVTIVCVYLSMHWTSFWRYRLPPAVFMQIAAIGGLLLLSRGTGALALLPGLVLVGCMMGYSYFSGIFYSTTGLGPRRLGLASGLHEAALALGFLLGSLGGGYISQQAGIRYPYLICLGVLSVFVVLQTLVFWVVGRRSEL